MSEIIFICLKYFKSDTLWHVIHWEVYSVLCYRTIIVYGYISQMLLKTSLEKPEVFKKIYFLQGRHSIPCR